jgi:hypothetical protein
LTLKEVRLNLGVYRETPRIRYTLFQDVVFTLDARMQDHFVHLRSLN